MSLNASAQNADSTTARVIIHDIIIIGNKKTKAGIILREIPFKEKDSLPSDRLKTLLLKARENIYNTRLFISVDVNAQQINNNEVIVVIDVKERWYTYPLPYIELADRSFNVWWHTYHADLKRLSYGVYFIQENLSGRNDILEIKATAGFNKELKMEYTTPYLSQKRNSRLRLGGGVLYSNELPYITSDSNKLKYFQSTQPVRKEWNVSIGLLTRKYIKKREWLTLSVTGINVFDSINFYNPHFFYGNSSHIVYPELTYKFKYDDVDNIIYPLKGKLYEGVVSKRGFGWKGGLNMLSLSASAGYYFPLGHDWFSSLKLTGEIKLPFEQPYYNTKAAGYGDNYIRGYEYYVIDGTAFYIAKADLKRKLVYFELPTFLKSKNYSKIPFTLYGKIYSDLGSVYSRKNSMLNNKTLWGGGLGLDIVTLYDISISINFSLNDLKEQGFYFHAAR